MIKLHIYSLYFIDVAGTIPIQTGADNRQKTLTELYNEKMRSIDERRSRIPVLDLTTPGRTYSELMENALA